MKQVALWAMVATSAFLSGCDSGRPGLVKVTGRVTLNGGDWPYPGVLILAPISSAAAGGSLRPALAPFDTSGHFVAQTWKPGDGVLPGTYKVAVECWEVPPTMDGPPAQGPVPEKYRTVTTSDLQIEVSPDRDDVEVTLDVPTRAESRN